MTEIFFATDEFLKDKELPDALQTLVDYTRKHFPDVLPDFEPDLVQIEREQRLGYVNSIRIHSVIRDIQQTIGIKGAEQHGQALSRSYG